MQEDLFAAVTLFGVLRTFVAFWYFTVYGELKLQPTIVAYSTIAVLGLGLFVSFVSDDLLRQQPNPNFPVFRSFLSAIDMIDYSTIQNK